MKCGLLWILVTTMAFQNLAAENANEHYTVAQKEKTNPYLEEIYKQIDAVEGLNRVKHRDSVAFIIGSNKYIDEGIPLAREFIKIFDLIDLISRDYDYLKRYLIDNFENETLLNLANYEVSSKDHDNLQNMENLHLKLFGSEDIIGQLASGNQLFHVYSCRSPQSPQQFLYSMYVEYVLAELKAHALIVWSWMILRKFGQGGSIEQEERSRDAYMRRVPSTLSRIKDLMNGADRSVWRCDPSNHKVGVTYEEVTRLLQGYIENEVDLNRDGSCSRDCAFYKSTKSEGCTDKKFCSEQPKCSGGVYDCRFVESDMKVCQAAKNSNRRYEFIQYESGRVLGNGGSCHTWLCDAKSWRRWIFMQCSYCLCLCDDQGDNSDRYFNLRPVIAEVEKNRVVTGLRFVKRNRVFHLQIQEGELLPRGVISESTLYWVPVDSYSVSDKDVRKDIDYHMLSYEKRSIDLDDLNADNNNSVVTGLRFKVKGTHLHLEAQFSRFEFQSGVLIEPQTTSYWMSGSDDERRGKVPLKDPQVSTRSLAASIPYPSDNQFFEFTNTGFDKDAGQTTVPFIDIQDVISKPAVPLSGIGIYYKGRDGFGGFLAPKIITYDFSPHVQLPKWESA